MKPTNKKSIMSKMLLSLLLLLALTLLSGCAKIDTNLALGSVINEADTTTTTSVPTPEPTPPQSGYEDSSYGGGDSGAGISSFSSGGYFGGGSSGISISPLPDESKGKAVLVSSQSEVSVLAGQKLTISDKNLQASIEEAQNQLKNDKKFSKFNFLIVSADQKLSDPNVKVSLNDTYKNKVAYVFSIDNEGNIQTRNNNSDKDSISYILDDQHFVNRELKLDFSKEGTFLLVFGAN